MEKRNKKGSKWRVFFPIIFLIIIGISTIAAVNIRKDTIDKQYLSKAETTSELLYSQHHDIAEITKTIQDIYSEAENKKSNVDNVAMIATALIGFLTVLATIIFNPKLTLYQRENADQHKEIKDQLKMTWVRLNLESSLQSIVDHSLDVVPAELRNLIIERSALVMDFAKSVIISKFDVTIINQIESRLHYIETFPLESIDDLGEEFIKRFKVQDKVLLNSLCEKIKGIVHESHFNSKNDQFRIACETFLYEKINAMIKIYKEVNDKRKSC